MGFSVVVEVAGPVWVASLLTGWAVGSGGNVVVVGLAGLAWWRCVRRSGVIDEVGVRTLGERVAWEHVQRISVQATGRSWYAGYWLGGVVHFPFPLTDRVLRLVPGHVQVTWLAPKEMEHPHDSFYEEVAGPRHPTAASGLVRFGVPVLLGVLAAVVTASL